MWSGEAVDVFMAAVASAAVGIGLWSAFHLGRRQGLRRGGELFRRWAMGKLAGQEAERMSRLEHSWRNIRECHERERRSRKGA